MKHRFILNLKTEKPNKSEGIQGKYYS